MINEKQKISYPDAILRLRAKLGLSQEELAEKMKVSFVSVNRWENGHLETTKLQKVKLKELFIDNNIN